MLDCNKSQANREGTRGVRIVDGSANGHSGGIQNPRAVNGNGGGRGVCTTDGNRVFIRCWLGVRRRFIMATMSLDWSRKLHHTLQSHRCDE